MDGVEIIGNSPASAYLAAIMAAGRIPVTWYTSSLKETLRPALLRSTEIGRLRRFLAKMGAPLEFLLQGPQLETWGLPNGPVHRFHFDFNHDECDRWVDSTQLFVTLSEVARSLGVSLRPVPVLPLPVEQPDLNVTRFVDVDPQEIEHWGLPGLEDHPAQMKWPSTEIWFSKAGSDHQAVMNQFLWIEGCLGSLEPHPAGGYVLTLVADTRYAIDRAMASLNHARATGPRTWRALYLMNPGAKRRDFTSMSGLSPLRIPGAFSFGSSIGRHSPLLNLQLTETLNQADRLFEFILNEGPQPDNWNTLERRRFANTERKMALWEKCLSSKRFYGDFLAAASLLPKPLRHFLKTPV